MSSQISKSRVASSFSRAANSYDRSAQLQRDVGNELLQICQLKTASTVSTKKIYPVLDLGSGTGYFSEKLAALFPHSELICLDIAQGMLEHAKSMPGRDSFKWVCADAEALPLASNSIGLLFSSLAIQWCENLVQLFSEIDRVLKPGGLALISSLGPASLNELRLSWQGVDDKVHVNKFAPREEILTSLPASLSVEVNRQQMRVLEYEKLQQLTTDLKNIGAHNMNAGEAKGLPGRIKIKKFKRNYESFRQGNGKLPASYEVYYLCLRKAQTDPVERQKGVANGQL